MRVFSRNEENRFPLLVAGARVRSPEFPVVGKVSVRKGSSPKLCHAEGGHSKFKEKSGTCLSTGFLYS